MTWTTRPRFDYPAGIAGIRTGEGPPLVLIHGVGLNADSWGAQIDALSGQFTIHALDLPGHGESAELMGTPGLADFSDALSAALGAIAQPFGLAGHSLGALIALDIAVRHPGPVRAVAALNAVHRRSAEALASVNARAKSMSPDSVNDPGPTLSRWFADDPSAPEAVACRNWLTAVKPAAYKAAYHAFAEADSPAEDALRKLECPALFLTGADEPNSTPAMSEAMAALVPSGRVVVVPRAAHMAMMTHADTVNAVLAGFFGADA